MINKEQTIVCKCEQVSLAKIEALFLKGYDDIEVIKRLTRTTMGRCQGKHCMPILREYLANKTGRPLSDIRITTHRPPTIAVTIEDIAKGGMADD